jgi:hypothetical protein
MEIFELYNTIEKEEMETRFGIISIKHVKFDSIDIQSYLPYIIFDDFNLKFMFQNEIKSPREKALVLKRFLPDKMPIDIEEYIRKSIASNKTFYSFLAEGILGLVYRDLYGYDLSVGIIDINETLKDTHTGSDACMYDKSNNVLILGEAKFYEGFNAGIRAIISDFCKKDIFNKIDSFKRKGESNEESWQIILKNVKANSCELIPMADFLRQKIIFAGFVLHGNEIEMDSYLDDNFYDSFDASVISLKDNIAKCIGCEPIDAEYELVLLHLPIADKKELIKKIMERAYLSLNNIGGNKS